MDAVFSKILSMSLSACFVIVAVLLIRMLLRKAPRQYSYILWLLVFFRLLCPFTIESALSLVPISEDTVIYQRAEETGKIKVNTGIEPIDMVITRGLEKGNEIFYNENSVSYSGEVAVVEKEINLLERILSFMPIVWITGMIFLMSVSMLQIVKLKWKLQTAIRVNWDENVNVEWRSKSDNAKCPIYESAHIHTAFLLGIFRPAIYLPLGIEEERGYVIAHERMHLRRRDYLMKPICYLAVMIHWFNPLVWLSFYLMTKDMEMSCDEQVLKSAITDIRGEYSKSLLNLSVKGSGLSVPLAFGESNTKERIKHALKYRKPSTWIGIGAIIVLLVAAITLIPNASGSIDDISGEGSVVSEGNGQENDSVLPEGNEQENGSMVSEENKEVFFQQLSENRNPYIGDNSANGKLLGLLPVLEGYERKGMRLYTEQEPYQMDILYENTDPISEKQKQENIATMRRNAIYLFATIENMDICSFCLDNDDAITQTSYTRAEAEEVFGALYEKSETPEGLKELEASMEAYKKQMEEMLDSAVSVVTGEDVAKNSELITEQDLVIRVDNLISEAILEYVESQDETDSKHMEVHEILGGEEYVFEQLLQSDGKMVFYVLVKEAVYGEVADEAGGGSISEAEQGSKTINGENTVTVLGNSGSSFPTRIIIERNKEDSFKVTDFWVPEEGSFLDKNTIKEIFPEEYWEEAIYMEGYQDELRERLLEKAAKMLG